MTASPFGAKPCSERIIVKNATHNIPADVPEVVIAKIQDTVKHVLESNK